MTAPEELTIVLGVIFGVDVLPAFGLPAPVLVLGGALAAALRRPHAHAPRGRRRASVDDPGLDEAFRAQLVKRRERRSMYCRVWRSSRKELRTRSRAASPIRLARSGSASRLTRAAP